MKITLLAPSEGQIFNLVPPNQHPFLQGQKVNARTSDGELINWDWQNPTIWTEDTSFPESVTLTWAYPGDKPQEFEVLLAENPDLTDARRFSSVQCHLTLNNLKIATCYYWAVQLAGTLERSVVQSFKTLDQPPRWLRIPDISNVRDCGGWHSQYGGALRQGWWYRGSELDNNMHLTSEGKRILLDELKIKTELEIRGWDEIEKMGHQSALGPNQVNYYCLPLKPYNHFFLPENAASNRECLELMLHKENYPIYCHCVGGADRTGTVVFMLQALLGVADRDLVKDYELTTFSVFGARSTESMYYQNFMQAFRQYGTDEETFAVKAVRYYHSIGITDEQLAALRQLLIDFSK